MRRRLSSLQSRRSMRQASRWRLFGMCWKLRPSFNQARRPRHRHSSRCRLSLRTRRRRNRLTSHRHRRRFQPRLRWRRLGRAAPVDAPAQAAPVVATPVQVPAATPPKVQVDFRVEAVGKTAPAEIKRTEALRRRRSRKHLRAPIVAPIVAKTAPRVVEAPAQRRLSRF